MLFNVQFDIMKKINTPDLRWTFFPRSQKNLKKKNQFISYRRWDLHTHLLQAMYPFFYSRFILLAPEAL